MFGLFHFSLLGLIFGHLWIVALLVLIAGGAACYFMGPPAFLAFILNPRTLLAGVAIIATLGYFSLKSDNDKLHAQNNQLAAQVQTISDGQKAVSTKVIIQKQNAVDKAQLTKVIQDAPTGQATDDVLDAIDSQQHAGGAGVRSPSLADRVLDNAGADTRP